MRLNWAMPFLSLGLTPALARAAALQGYTQPTPVQTAAIAPILRGLDVQACAQTGSGKTAAYALPLLQILQQSTHATPRRVRVLVLVPTRELAAQVGEVLRSLAQHLAQTTKIAIVFGGVSINPQMMGLRGGADVVVATPGRLLDLVAHNALHLGSVHSLVLDEADRLLDLGFADELARVLALLPAQRQNLLLSATFAPEVQALANGLLREPLHIDIAPAASPTAIPAAGSASGPAPGSEGPGAEPPGIVQRAIAVDAAQRTALLRHLHKAQPDQRMLVFVATQYSAERVAEKLYRSGIFATPFHGGLSQGARQEALDEFKAKRWDVVVTTDLAARGIDIAELPIVVNYDLPRSATDYVHRIGRTGRAGQSGTAISFVSANSQAHWGLIQKRQNLSLPLEEIAGFEPKEVALDATAEAVRGTGGVKGKRPSKKDKLRAAGLMKAPD